jgi:UDP-glucuronate 4-epimerase
MKVLLTGGAGFIGSHLAEALLEQGEEVVVLDDFNDYYSPLRKENNLKEARRHPGLEVLKGDIRDRELLESMFSLRKFPAIVHLAARAGVRSSLEDPVLYQKVNVEGTLGLLEASRKFGVKKFIFASSSSVYGNNPHQPWRESDPDLQPESPYGATKLAGEHLCRIYHETYGLKMGVLRLFTVYGPRQRPDMAIHKFARLIWEGKKIPVFGDGSSRRDYTYVSDIVSGIVKALRGKFQFEIFNLGGGHSITLEELIGKIGKLLGKPLDQERLPFQAGDVESTWADIGKARELLGYHPRTRLDRGLESFVSWFRSERT